MNRRSLIRSLLIAPAAAAALPVLRSPHLVSIGELRATLEFDDRMTPALEAAAEAAHRAAAGLQRTAAAVGELRRREIAPFLVLEDLDDETIARLEREIEEYTLGLRRTITTRPVTIGYRFGDGPVEELGVADVVDWPEIEPVGVKRRGEITFDVVFDPQPETVEVELRPTGISGPLAAVES